MSQSCPAQTFVAQVSNRPYRGFPIRRRRETPVSQDSPAVSRLEVGDTADWKSALQPGETDPVHIVGRWGERESQASHFLLALLQRLTMIERMSSSRLKNLLATCAITVLTTMLVNAGSAPDAAPQAINIIVVSYDP